MLLHKTKQPSLEMPSSSASPENRVAMLHKLRNVWSRMRPVSNPDSMLDEPVTKPDGRVVRDTLGLPVTLGRLGSLELRLAITAKDIRRAQKLRYKVFFEEMSATAPAHLRLIKRDKDIFDRVCDHLLVIDHDCVSGPFNRRKPKVVGTYRLLRQNVADQNFGFYSEKEFDVARLIARNPDMRFLELGRSCVLAAYRTKKTVELLWQGIWAYVLHHRVDMMFGCASLEGTSTAVLASELSFLHHFCKAEGNWLTSAHSHQRAIVPLMDKQAIDPRRAMTSLPPLIKGYLRLGARIGDGVVVDHQFGTTDVLIILPVADIDRRYITYYGSDASRFTA